MREPGRGMWRAGIRFFSYPYSIDLPAGKRIKGMITMHEGPMAWTIEELADAQRAPLDLLLDADPSEEMVRGYLRDGICLVAMRDGQIAGILVYMRTRPLTAEIMIVSVREDCRNRGIARSLILRAIERARLEKYAVIEIGTGNPGVVQMLLYQKCGFRIVGVDPDYFRRNHKERIFENGIECRDMIRMRMEL